MPLNVERVVDRRVRFEETLREFLTLEPLHLSFAPSNDEMRVLCPIVVAQSSAMMTITETKSLERDAVGTESVGDVRCGSTF